ncbi:MULTISPECIES: hypothetical protein [Flavobacterium]|uniref:hypothetical protein n=1 Tax=Flavobacterium TaxID=237 RepID=UPI0021153A39|nr:MULTISPECIES: hypothetical protein [Flavobacterium]UUF16416.1 hypothetical protein NLJ00_09905 [Flavobacterium panici]
MRTKFKNAARLIVIFMILITSTKCQTDDHLEQANDKTLLSAKTWFNNYEAESINFELFQNLDYDWNNAAITKSEDGTKTIIIPINEIKKDPTETWEQKLYIYKLGENNYEALLFEIYPDSKNTDPENSLIDSGIFTGYMAAWDLKKGFVKAALFENGKVAQNGSIKVYSKNKSITGKAPSNQANCPAGVECDTDGSGDTGTQLKEVVINNNYQNPPGYVIIYNNNGGGYAGDTSPGGYTNHGTGASGITAPTPAEIADALQKKIDGSKLDPCPKAVLEQLKNATNCDIANILNKLGANNIYNVTIISQTPSNNSPAQTLRTDPKIRYDYTIKISQDYTSATRLFRAANILHEITHAFFMSLQDDYSSSGNLAVFGDTQSLFQAFCDKKYPGSSSNAHHQEMANTYVNAIGAALQEFQTGIPVPNGVMPNQIYTDLAWGGLLDAPVFTEIYPTGSSDYIRIKARYESEGTGRSVKNQVPIGKPCQ